MIATKRTLTYKLLNDHQPGYLSSLISPYTLVRSLRSSVMSLLTQTLARLSIGRHAFSVCAPRLWNALPSSIRSATSLSSFKRSLKTHYFQTLTPSWSLAIARASDSAIGRYLVIDWSSLISFYLNWLHWTLARTNLCIIIIKSWLKKLTLVTECT